jgi:hypothetical protein
MAGVIIPIVCWLFDTVVSVGNIEPSFIVRSASFNQRF